MMVKVLGSIKNIEEASIVAKYNFDIIDIKNIEDGALGYVGDSQLRAISKKIAHRKLSVTAGNQIHPNNNIMNEKIQLFNSLGIEYIKIGIFDVRHLNEHKLFLEKTSSLKIKKVGVLFADKELEKKHITDLCKLNYDGLMIDTIDKSNRCTLDILNKDLISIFVNECHQSNKFCGISGSMTYQNIENAMSFKPDFIGYRGALCSSSNRNNLEGSKCKSILTKIKDTNQKMYQEVV